MFWFSRFLVVLALLIPLSSGAQALADKKWNPDPEPSRTPSPTESEDGVATVLKLARGMSVYNPVTGTSTAVDD